jgi:hypothetical protein
LFTLGREAGKLVKRKRVVVGDEVSTLSEDSTVVSNTVDAAVVPVYLEIDFAVPYKPICLLGVRVGGEGLKGDSLEPLPKIELSSFTVVLGGEVICP